jgi:hypothetical protein
MTVTEDQDQLEKEQAEKIVAETRMLDGVRAVRVELGEDHTGDPAMWLVFSLSRDLDFADEAILNRFLDYTSILQTKILHSGLTRFPYTRLENAA